MRGGANPPQAAQGNCCANCGGSTPRNSPLLLRGENPPSDSDLLLRGVNPPSCSDLLLRGVKVGMGLGILRGPVKLKEPVKKIKELVKTIKGLGEPEAVRKNLKIWRFAPNFEIFPYHLGLTQPFDICQALAVNPLLFSCPTPCFLVKPLSIDQPLVISLVKPFLP